MKLKWGKPKLQILELNEDGTFPASPVWVDLPSPKQDTTNLTPTKGTKNEATAEGGGIVDARYDANKNEVTFDLFATKGASKPIFDVDGVVAKNYALRIIPEDATQSGYQMDYCSVNVQDVFTPKDGGLWRYTFDVLKPLDGSHQIKEYYALVVDKNEVFMGQAIDSTGKTVTATSTGNVSATVDANSTSWLSVTCAAKVTTIKTLTANSGTAVRVGYVTITADGKSAVVKVTQIF